ncbi:MAG: UDP-N-acetylglucosamine pyrophosphorylase [Lachnospiraceae bacterium]|nr:UDP-N-acetylglucosamine pyrophosphorylase [Lachnospiraceae bacterium]
MEEALVKNLYTLSETLAGDYLSGFDYPWEALSGIGELIKELSRSLDMSLYEDRGDQVFIARSAKIWDLNTIIGPCIIGENTEVRPGAFIRGKALVGNDCVVGNSTELKNVILFNHVQVPHYNYVGDSILGFYSHMGAGSITSNVKSDKQLVTVKDRHGNKIETGLKKFGAMLGDHVEVGCNTVLNPGTVVGKNTNIYPTSCVRGVIPADSIYKNQETVVLRKKD